MKMQYHPGDQQRLLDAALAKTRRLRAAADLLIATAFEPNPEALAGAVAMGLDHQETEARRVLKGQCPFHWPVEFPEVFLYKGGFDAIVGNPPYLGGSRISGALGDSYLKVLLQNYAETSGNGDLASFFVRRAAQLTRQQGTISLVTTNSIAQGTTRENSLDYLVERGFVLYRARKTLKWPGSANVFISLLHIYHGNWQGTITLDGESVASISPYLDSDASSFSLFRLKANHGLVFRGSTISGEGFIINQEDKAALTAIDPKSENVIKPFLTGQDINQEPTQRSSRFAIDLGARSEHEAMTYSACWDHLYRTVRLQRVGNKIASREQFWWQFIGRQESLYATIDKFPRVLGCGQVSKYWCVSWLDPGQVFADKVVIFALSSDGDFGALNSCFHVEWAEKTSSRLKGDPNYNLANTFETFPRPISTSTLENLGQQYHLVRQRTMMSRGEGLTSIYNRFHTRRETSSDITGLRALQVELDQVVAAAFGWNDIDLCHDFHQTNQGLRYTISDAAKREVVNRLLALNHERYAQEQTAGQSPVKAKQKARKPASTTQPALF